jgi:hypothetical protein
MVSKWTKVRSKSTRLTGQERDFGKTQKALRTRYWVAQRELT